MLYTGKSLIHGDGLFTDTHIANGELVCIAFEGSGRSIFEYSQTLNGRFTNHSVQPNTRIAITNGGIGLFALTDIPQNKEITADYNKMMELLEDSEKYIKFW